MLVNSKEQANLDEYLRAARKSLEERTILGSQRYIHMLDINLLLQL